MPLLRGNLHAHTTFSDGLRPAAEVVARYRELGYDFLAITDHEDRVEADYWRRLPRGSHGLLVLPGIELDFRPLSQHVGKVMGERETLYVLNHPARYRLSAEEAVRRAAAITDAGWPVHAVEVTDTGRYRPEYDVAELALARVATDDSHRDADVGRAWIEVDAARNPDAIIRAIKAGQFRLGFAAAPDPVSGPGSSQGRKPGGWLRSGLGLLAGLALCLTAASAGAAPSASRQIGPEEDLCTAINALGPGQELVLLPGDYRGPCAIRRGGAPGAPIVVRAQSLEARPRIVYAGDRSNVIEVRTDHVVLRGLAIGPTQANVDGVRVYGARDIVVEDSAFTDLGGIAVVANHASVRGLTVRRNVIRASRATAMYFGCHDGVGCTVTDLLVEGNVIHTVRAPEPQIGYGIQVKLNSTGVIRDNVAVDTKGPGIMVYGSRDPTAATVVERNVTVGSLQSAGIVVGGGPVLVRNNVATGNDEGGIALQDYARRGLLRGVMIVHNTVYANRRGGILVPGNGVVGAVIANNAAHAPAGAQPWPDGGPGLSVAGNVDCSWGGCFVDPGAGDFSPLPGGRLVGAGSLRTDGWMPREDFWGAPRGPLPVAGAVSRAGGPVPLGLRP
jgi:hypothetical protein